MNVTEQRQKIAAARQRITTLTAWVSTLEETRTVLIRALAGTDDKDPRTPRRLAELEQVEHGYSGGSWAVAGKVQEGFQQRLPGLLAARSELGQLLEAVELLEAELPSGEAIARASAELEVIAGEAREHEAMAATRWHDLLELLSDAAETAADLTARRGAYAEHAGRAHSHAIEWGLPTGDLPPRRVGVNEVLPAVPFAEERLAGALLDVLTAALRHGEISSATRAAVEDLRRALRREDRAA